MRLDPETLDGPPDLGARILGLARLADLEDALARLEARDGRDGVRAVRRALRRLECALRAAAPAAAPVPEVRLARLAAAGRRAAPARDAEALGGWLHGIRASLPGPYRGALDWLVDRAERRREGAREAREEAARRLRRLVPELHRDLTARRPPAPSRPAGAPATFAGALAVTLRARTRAFREAAGAVAGPADATGLERARVEARRLADALEPLGGSGVSAAEALDAVGPLEALLAEWRDASAAEAALEGALLEARAEEARRGEAALAGLRPGLLAVLALAQRRAGELAARVAGEHLGARAAAATDAAYAVVAALEARSAGGEDDAGPSAPERRFLVTAVPPEGRGGDVEELEQGWLPGDGRESVGVTRSPLGEQWFRAHAPGRGRAPRQQAISRAEFEAFWPLSEGRRIAKRRHLVADAPGWLLDEYLDRPLVLAIAEEGNAGEPPAWLEPVLVREVSKERGYHDESLARRPPRRAG